MELGGCVCVKKVVLLVLLQLPEKPVSSLVKYYYLWKRSYSQYSLMDKHSKKNGRRIV